jgi:hypothetical protein
VKAVAGSWNRGSPGLRRRSVDQPFGPLEHGDGATQVKDAVRVLAVVASRTATFVNVPATCRRDQFITQ